MRPPISRAPSRVLAGAALAVITLGLVWACSETDVPTVPRSAPRDAGAPRASLAGAYGTAQPVVFRSQLAENRCLDVLGANPDVGADVGMWGCNGLDNQTWRWGGDGLVRIAYNGVERCLIMWGDLNAPDGTPVRVSTCHGAANQRWVPTADGAGLRLRDQDRCVTIAGASAAAGAAVVIAPCAGAAHQRWVARTPEEAWCGVSFRAVVTDEDALLASYGIPATTDTVHVCETWTGSDYVVRETTVGSAPNAFRDPDPARTVVYSGGQVTGIAADGGPAHDGADVGPTAFDFMQVDAAGRQAAYDDPYHVVYAGEDPACGSAIRCSVGTATGTSETVGPLRAAAPDTGKAAQKFTKHGLKRRGVRALVDDAAEVGRSPEGHRRFRKRRGDAEVVLTLDKDTELLVGEETTRPEGTTKATHVWKKNKQSGYVRERSEIETVETVNGRPMRSRTTVTLLDVALNSGSSAPATPSALRSRTPR